MDFLEGLNPQQRKAVLHVDGPLLLLAGAGSGKTRVITHRMAHLVSANGVPGPAILAVTFTNKAAGEMRERTMKLLGESSARRAPFVSTFHSFCVRLLRRDGASLSTIRPGFTTSFNIYDDADQLSIVKSVFRHLGIDEKFMQYRAALSRISHAKNHKETPEDFYKNATDPKAERMAVIFEQYEGKLRQANALDFDDLLLESVRLLRNDTMIREAYNRRFEFVMIDEYQDTNRTQYEMMRLLTEVRENVAVVGDEDQSIYGWRGADIKNILDFQKDFPKASVIRLEQNYRSVKNILEAAGAVVANNRERLGKNLWTDAGAGDKITVFEAMDGEQEALYIADNVERELGRNPRHNVAVLYRTNFQSRQIEEALRRYNRKYVVVGGLSFYDRAEVKDMLCYLKVLSNPNDSVSLERIINVPARGIGKTTFEQIEKYATENKLAIWPALLEMLEKRLFPGRAEAAVSAFERLISELQEGLEQRKVHETLNLILDRTGYRRMIETEQTPEAENRIGNLVELVNAAADGSERGETLAEFLDHAALVADADSVDEKSQVSLLTIHNAKGLEWPVVFLAGMEEGLFPHSRSRESETHLEEERRL
ncbi:MAG: UvrD-helicase domain-containing protein, partial [Acidobacteria bacterium]|nr:UvrD-helicase domain-containing protein [Acidobacteriota bacterium]